ncbi:MAG: ABC transporter permease subunit [bacterium]
MNESMHPAQGEGNQPLPPKMKRVRRSVLIFDRLADWIIRVGGILVILAVLGILIYLVKETLPLFRGGHLTASYGYQLPVHPGKILATGLDEYQTVSYVIYDDGTLLIFHTRTGSALGRETLDLGGARITAVSESIDKQHLALGFSNGQVRLLEITFPYQIVTREDLPAGLMQMDEQDSVLDNVVYSRVPGNQFRRATFKVTREDPVTVSAAGNPIVAIDYRVSGEAERKTNAFVAVEADGKATLNVIKTRVNLMTGERKNVIRRSDLPVPQLDAAIHSVLMTDRADMVLIVTENGRAYRYDTSDFNQPILAEVSPLLSSKTTLKSLGFLNGNQSLVVGGADGSLVIYFVINDRKRGTRDGKALVKARAFKNSRLPIIAFSPSSRGKGFAVAYQDGSATILHGTSQKRVLEFGVRADSKIKAIALSPRFDGLLQIYADGYVRFHAFSVPHPETTFYTLFQKVWYEGYEQPSYTWQSSAATDDYEQKFSLIPLIFGSIKVALYSLLFAVPIAILSAIYTSEFVHFRVRNTVKPAMEMMASLPSVVLGFVAALVLAPIVETWIAAVLSAFLVIPAALVLGAFFWQMLPQYLIVRWQGGPKLFLMFCLVAAALGLTQTVGPWLENLLFHGDFKAWLNRDVGTAEPFLFLVLLPILFLLTAMIFSRLLKPPLSRWTAERGGGVRVGADILYWILSVAVAVFVASRLAGLMAFYGFDARGGVINTYVQRNTLVVGFAMGFAVIPIIYTIAEDALHSVPDHLRAASLGCGATQWQTTIYVVLPAAISGVFSAIMIGMGRAVGETMIVVMAAGNTPLMDWNIFNGLRALSATIAVELPEAVKGGTLYRVLFLSGLVLFAMTFVINTIAEVVRLRFRKRTQQL